MHGVCVYRTQPQKNNELNLLIFFLIKKRKTDVNFIKTKKQQRNLTAYSNVTMSVVSRVKRFFAQTIAGYSEVMKEPNPDWEIVAKRMMFDFRAFNTEISVTPSTPDEPERTSKVNQSSSEEESLHIDWEKLGSDFDINEFEAESLKNSPIKTGYEYDSDYNPESEDVESTTQEEEDFKSKAKSTNENSKKCYTNKKGSQGGRRLVRIAESLDFTMGWTRVENRYRVHDQTVCDIVQKVLREEVTVNHDGVFFKCARNWYGEIQKGLVVNTNGVFYVYYAEKGTFTKTVSQKDRHIYHDAYRICAPILVYCTFVKNHPGLQGESLANYRVIHINGRFYDLNIDNLELKKLRKAM